MQSTKAIKSQNKIIVIFYTSRSVWIMDRDVKVLDQSGPPGPKARMDQTWPYKNDSRTSSGPDL